MEMSPNQVRSATFKAAKRGYDPDEVATFLRGVAEALEAAQNQSTAMEARARAAVARLQELSAAKDAAPADDEVHVGPDQAETITRTLLLAQRTADTTVAEAQAEAERLLSSARAEAATTIDSTREMSAMMLDEARAEARRVTSDEHEKAASEVQSLRARRDFLEADVDHLERFLADQRARLREASTSLLELAERVPGGLGETRRPVLSAADDPTDRGAGADLTGPDLTGRTEPRQTDPGPIDEEPIRPGADESSDGEPTEAIDVARDHDIDDRDDDAGNGVVDDEPVGTAGPLTDDGSLASLAAALDAAAPADWSRGTAGAPVSADDPTPADEEQQLRFGTNPLSGSD